MKEFPEFPRDPQSLGLLKGLETLSRVISSEASHSPSLNKCAGYLHILGHSPIMFPEFYFRMFQHLQDDIVGMSEHYNKYIYRRGQDYMLDLLNNEIGEFSKYFDQFQLIMYSINERANWDDRLEPLNQLLWGFYCSLFDSEKKEEYLNKTLRFIERSRSENRAQFYN
jgi:hypothetical protein